MFAVNGCSKATSRDQPRYCSASSRSCAPPSPRQVAPRALRMPTIMPVAMLCDPTSSMASRTGSHGQTPSSPTEQWDSSRPIMSSPISARPYSRASERTCSIHAFSCLRSMLPSVWVPGIWLALVRRAYAARATAVRLSEFGSRHSAGSSPPSLRPKASASACMNSVGDPESCASKLRIPCSERSSVLIKRNSSRARSSRDVSPRCSSASSALDM